MDVSAVAAPPPGSAQAGDLYVDLQSRTLWLGVDIAVDPSGFVLISDIVAQMAEDADIRLDSKMYTDQALQAFAAPIIHTHTASQITDFASAVTVVVAGIPGFNWVKGMIMQYSGSLAEIGVGELAGWALCNGANGTPDLRDRFIVGAGNKAVGTKNPNAYTYVTGGGVHSHSVNATVLSIENLPSHAHGGTTNYVSNNHSHYVSGGTDGQGVHNHSPIVVPGSSADNGDPGNLVVTAGSQGNGNRSTAGYTANAGNHGHNFSAWSGGISENHYHQVYAEGSNVGHTHTLVGGQGHHNDHYLTSEQLRESLPYYALAFIMKL